MSLSNCARTCAFLGFLLATSNLNAAGLSLSGTVTPQSGSFLYELLITNDGPDDYSLVSIVDAPPGDV